MSESLKGFKWAFVYGKVKEILSGKILLKCAPDDVQKTLKIYDIISGHHWPCEESGLWEMRKLVNSTDLFWTFLILIHEQTYVNHSTGGNAYISANKVSYMSLL